MLAENNLVERVKMAEQLGRTGDRGGWRAVSVGLSVLAVVLFAAVFVRVPDRAFADDSYFYFQVAWHMARGLGSRFNDMMPTNGYHPLWLLVCTLVFKVLPERAEAVHGIALVISVLDAVMLLTVGRLMDRFARGMWALSFLLLIPFCFASQLGTEGALSGMMLALLALMAVRLTDRPTLGRAFGFNTAVALAVLSRLDNVFVVAAISVAVFLALRGAGRRLQVGTLVVPAVLWAGYVGSNWVLFHTIQPISGMLKATSGRADHVLGGNLPHTALIAGAIILVLFPVVALRSRDRFFRVVELPLFVGVLIHAFYIVFIMSSETRWTWYYTSWMLLAGMLLARAGAVLLPEGTGVRAGLAVCSLLLLPIWFRSSLQKFLLGPETKPPANFNAEVYGRLGVHRAIAYDEPGVFAYYSDIEIVPIDGLMGDLAFQHELATKGIEEFVRREHIDAFIGPPERVGAAQYKNLCAKIFLSSERFDCVPQGDGLALVQGVEIYARRPPTDAGRLVLAPEKKVYEIPNGIAVWRLE